MPSRFDYAVNIIELMKKYMDSCANDENTHGMVTDAMKSIKNLKDIELSILESLAVSSNISVKSLQKVRETPKCKNVTSIIGEVNEKLDALKSHSKIISDFISENKQDIETIKATYAQVKEVYKSIRHMETTNSKLDHIIKVIRKQKNQAIGKIPMGPKNG